MSTSRRPALSRRAITRIILPALAGLAAAAPADAATLAAPAASSFRDSIGVQLHVDFQGYAYQADTTPNLVKAVRNLGVRHVRDRVCMDKPEVCAKVVEKLKAVGSAYEGAGPDVDLIVGVMPNVDAPRDRAERDAVIAAGLRQVRDAPYAADVAGIEMVNEPDLLKEGDWATQTVEDAKTLHRLLAEPEFASLRDIPLLAPALGRQTATPALLKAGWTQDLADIPNMHPYPATYTVPETALDLACDGPLTVLDCAKSMALHPTESYATESGYSTAGTILVSDWVSQRAQATYTLRLLLNNFREGVERTYLYELVDLLPAPTFRNHGYGLMKARLNPDGKTFRIGSPKLAYLAIQRMNAVIGDLGAPAKPGVIDVDLADAVTGAAIPADQLDRVVLRRADGTYVLAVWQRAKAFSFLDYKPRDLTVPARPVRVSLDGSQGDWEARWSVPATSSTTVPLGSGARFELPVTDDVTLIELTPPAALRGPVDPVPSPTPTPTPIPEPTPDPDDPVEFPEPTATPAPSVPIAERPAEAPAPTAPRTDEPRPAVESQTRAPAAQLPARDPAAAAREKANRRERARIRASRAYAACLDRLVAQAQRRKRAGNARPRPSRPTQEMREQCDRSLAR